MMQIDPSHLAPSHSARRAHRVPLVAAILAAAALPLLAAAPLRAADEPGQTAMVEPGQVPEAVTQAAPAAAPAPKAAPALSAAVAAGLNAYNAGDFGTAAKRLEAAAAGDPSDPAAPYFLGYTYYRMGQFAQSRAAFARAYQTDPDYSPEPPAAK